jgi:hypothetical protein
MYRVLLERGAERDLSRLTPEIHNRVLAAIKALGVNPRPPIAANWPGPSTTGDFVWVTTASFAKLPTPSASFG